MKMRRLRFTSFFVFSGCLLVGEGRKNAPAQDVSTSTKPQPGTPSKPAFPETKASVPGDPRVVPIDPTQIPDYRPHRTDITDLLQNAINSSAGPLSIVIPAGTFVIRKGHIRIDHDFVQLQGAGNGHTILHFQPDSTPVDQSPSVLFVFQKPDNSTLSGGGIRDLHIVSDEVSFQGLKDGIDQYASQVSALHTKVAIRLVNTSLFALQDVIITQWWGRSNNGDGSIGLQVQGREAATISRILIQADIPIRIEPNADGALRWIGVDHFHFQDLNLIATGKNPCIHILPDTPLTNTTFDGYQTWNRGGYGFKWDGAGNERISIGLAIHNARWEQATAPGGYMIYINQGSPLYNLLLSNLNSMAQHPARPGETSEPIVNGIYLRNVRNVRVENFLFDGASTGIRFDQAVVKGSAAKPTVINASLTNVFFPEKALQVDLAGGLHVSGTYMRGAELVRLADRTDPSR